MPARMAHLFCELFYRARGSGLTKRQYEVFRETPGVDEGNRCSGPGFYPWTTRGGPMSKETPADDPRQLSQTDKPWKGNPEKEQRNDDTRIDLEKWQRTNTH